MKKPFLIFVIVTAFTTTSSYACPEGEVAVNIAAVAAATAATCAGSPVAGALLGATIHAGGTIAHAGAHGAYNNSGGSAGGGFAGGGFAGTGANSSKNDDSSNEQLSER